MKWIWVDVIRHPKSQSLCQFRCLAQNHTMFWEHHKEHHPSFLHHLSLRMKGRNCSRDFITPFSYVPSGPTSDTFSLWLEKHSSWKQTNRHSADHLFVIVVVAAVAICSWPSLRSLCLCVSGCICVGSRCLGSAVSGCVAVAARVRRKVSLAHWATLTIFN